ncbi:hypothetical protein JTB14_012548 [Gonioctena quinquepunctata]|nr:hypothetical protein JTB14_012548 [Gonioctena quinquepunctata]
MDLIHPTTMSIPHTLKECIEYMKEKLIPNKRRANHNTYVPLPTKPAWNLNEKTEETNIREQTRPSRGRTDAREAANSQKRGPREIHATLGSPSIPTQDGPTE